MCRHHRSQRRGQNDLFAHNFGANSPPYSGETELGASLNVGYFAQAHEDLIESNNLIEEINREAPRMLPGEVRDYLAKYGFRRMMFSRRLARFPVANADVWHWRS